MKSVTDADELDFDVLRDGWNRYQLPEGVVLRVRAPILKIFKKRHLDASESEGYLTAGSTIFDVMCPPKVKGVPSESEAITKADIVQDDVEFNIIHEEWSEYLLLPDKKL